MPSKLNIFAQSNKNYHAAPALRLAGAFSVFAQSETVPMSKHHSSDAALTRRQKIGAALIRYGTRIAYRGKKGSTSFTYVGSVQRISENDKIYISGTGRAGTTFLIQLFTRLGLETGFDSNSQKSKRGRIVYYETARAGYEKDIFDPFGPRIVKSPYLCDHVDEVLAKGISIGHVFVPVRPFNEAAESRRHVQREATGSETAQASVAGGLWDVSNAQDQADVLKEKFANLVEALVRNDIPITFLQFPRFAKDPDYLYERISFLIPNMTKERFIEEFNKEVRPELIHDFSEKPE